MELSHCVRVHSRNFLWWCHQLIWCHRHGVGGRDFNSQDKRSKGPLEPKWWPKWILIKSQDKRPPTVNALAQTLQAPHWCYWYLNRKTVHPLRRIRISAKMGGLPSSTGQLPSAADGSRIDAIPNGRIASAANTNGRAGRWGGPPSTYAVWSRCRISWPSAPVRPAVRRSTRCGPCQSAAWDISGRSAPVSPVPATLAPWDRGENISGPLAPASPRPLRGCVSGPSGIALPACQGPRHLRYPPLTQFPGGRPPPCPTQCPAA